MSAPPAPATGARLDLGVLAGTRWIGEAAMTAGGVAHVALGPWIVGASGRWSWGVRNHGLAQVRLTDIDGRAVAAGYKLSATELGVDLGRQARLGPVEVTALVGPRIAKLSQDLALTITDARPMAPPDPGPINLQTRDTRTVRLGGGLRALWAQSARLRMTIEVDASIDLADDAGDHAVPTVATPALATWALAVSLGGQFQVWP